MLPRHDPYLPESVPAGTGVAQHSIITECHGNRGGEDPERHALPRHPGGVEPRGSVDCVTSTDTALLRYRVAYALLLERHAGRIESVCGAAEVHSLLYTIDSHISSARSQCSLTIHCTAVSHHERCFLLPDFPLFFRSLW